MALVSRTGPVLRTWSFFIASLFHLALARDHSRTHAEGQPAGPRPAAVGDRGVACAVSAQDGGARARRQQGVVQGPDDVSVPAAGVGDVRADVLAGYRDLAGLQQACLGEFPQHGRQPAGIAEVLHEEPAGWHQVDERRHRPGQRVKVVEGQRHPEAACDGQ